jgi:signal transduction histidine kinase
MRALTWSMRFAIAISAVFALAALAAGGVSYVLQSEEMARRLQDEVRADTQSLALAVQDGDMQDLRDQIAARVAVTRDGAGLVVFLPADGGAALGNARMATPFEGVRHLMPGAGLTLIAPADQAAPLQNPPDGYVAYGMQLTAGWLMTARDDAWQREQTEILLSSFGWGLGLALLLSTGFAIFIARRTEARIRRMESVLEAVGAGHHALRIRDAGEDDVARLAQSVDRALDQLEAGIDAIRQVSTDVAHDLRAPLARLRLRLEPVALDATLPPEARQEIGSALADLDQISGTFDAILRLSRMQSGMVEITPASVDLVEMCRRVHDMMQASAEDAGHALFLDLPAQARIEGDAGLLTQALVNLVDNAIRHCPPPAQISIEVHRAAGRVALSVCDTGPGIPAAELGRVRERFMRLDRSRHTPGNGLGLSLVDAIATLHHAQFTLANMDKGLCATLDFASASL